MKTENLLIGNGVNLNVSHLFTSKEIIKRIEKTMQFGIDFLSLQNNISFLRDIKDNFDFDNFSSNLENKYEQYGFMLLERVEVEKHKDVYHNLDNLNDITLYGISPKGDKLLIDRLANIPVVVIFVYDMISNVEEVEIWKRCIPHAELFDSKEFLM